MDRLEIDLDKLQKLQDGFSEATHVFSFCVDEDGRKLTHLSGNRVEAKQIMASVEADKLANMLGHVMASRVEDQIVERGTDPAVRVACLAIKVNHVPLLNWIIYGVIESSGQYNYSTTTTAESFNRSLDVLRMGTQSILMERYEAMNALVQSQKSRSQEEALQIALRKSRAMTDVMQYLESDAPIEAITGDVLKLAGRLMDISNAFIIRPNDSETGDLIGEYIAPDARSLFDKRLAVPMPEFALDVERCVAISSDSKISRPMRDKLLRHDIEAIVMVPIFIHGRSAMVACYMETRRMRSFLKDEIQFFAEITRIMQVIIEKRIQKNSLEGSFESLEHILDNVGGGIFVRDIISGSLVYANDVIKERFEGIETDGYKTNAFLLKISSEAEKILEDERLPHDIRVHDDATGRWYDLHRTYMRWVNGRSVVLCALHDITELVQDALKDSGAVIEEPAADTSSDDHEPPEGWVRLTVI